MKTIVLVLLMCLCMFLTFIHAGNESCRSYGCGSCCKSDSAMCCDINRFCGDFPKHQNCRGRASSVSSTSTLGYLVDAEDEEVIVLSNGGQKNCAVKCASYSYMDPKEKGRYLPICSCLGNNVRVNHKLRFQVSEKSVVCANLQDMYDMSDVDNAIKKVADIAFRCQKKPNCMCLRPDEVPALFKSHNIVESPSDSGKYIASIPLHCGDIVKVKGYRSGDPFLTVRGKNCDRSRGGNKRNMRCAWFHSELMSTRQQWKIVCSKDPNSKRAMTLGDRFGLKSVSSGNFAYVTKKNVAIKSLTTITGMSTFSLVSSRNEPESEKVLTGEAFSFVSQSAGLYLGQTGRGGAKLMGKLNPSTLFRFYKEE